MEGDLILRANFAIAKARRLKQERTYVRAQAEEARHRLSSLTLENAMALTEARAFFEDRASSA
jgi:hypothetical protein